MHETELLTDRVSFYGWQEMLRQFGQLIFLVSENTTGIGSAEKAAIQQLDDLTANGVEKLMRQHQFGHGPRHRRPPWDRRSGWLR